MKNFTLPAALLFSMAVLVSCSTDSEGIDDTSNPTIGPKVTLFTGSNTSGKINMYDMSDMRNVTNKSFQSTSRDSGGLRFDPIQGNLVEASRSENNVLVFENINNSLDGSSLAPTLRSDVQVENPRDIIIAGNKIIVSSDAAGPRDSNKFYVYDSNGDSVKLVKVFETGFQHWGIFLAGNTLYAAMDNSGSIAVYNNFLSNDSGVLTANDVFLIEGAKSLRGITYDDIEDTLFLADVGNPLDDSDGAIHTIKNFSVKYSGMSSYGTIEAQDIKTVQGSKSMLGNPIDLQYDHIGKVLYAAERSTNGGMALAFDNSDEGGDVSPMMQKAVSGISSIHLNVE
ncbi:YncE family protein [Nonlabens antarcticus]|uniref:hypothetical protein n=1 Tax=Nonlabens antarcticus TaxID=392714 RepID=UPI00189136B8|nr:hypothetical protein [Nonlabens antarcticus]